MKFKLLSIGQKFEYQGETYVKKSPLIASNVKTSLDKMIPAYAALTLLNQLGTQEQETKTVPIDAKEVLTAFNLFYATCISALEKNGALIPDIKDQLDKARDEFTKHLTK